MATDIHSRFFELRQWMVEHEVTYRFLAPHLDISEACVQKMLRNSTIPTRHHRVLVSLGFPVDLLPKGKDRKPGPRPKIPNLPVLCQQERRAIGA